jgi:hypothetical protein
MTKVRKLHSWSDVIGNDLSAREVLAQKPADADTATWLEKVARELWHGDIEGLDFRALARELERDAAGGVR